MKAQSSRSRSRDTRSETQPKDENMREWDIDRDTRIEKKDASCMSKKDEKAQEI